MLHFNDQQETSKLTNPSSVFTPSGSGELEDGVCVRVYVPVGGTLRFHQKCSF